MNDPIAKRDYRLNILRLHDEKHLGDAVYQAALAANGFRADGLVNAVVLSATPILCAKCHASEALGTSGARRRSAHALDARDGGESDKWFDPE